MMSKSGKSVHDVAVITAEATRQTAVSTAANQAAARTAEIAFYWAAVASGIANGLDVGPYIRALTDLGTGGV
jgi:hypothetical protein